jgi:hypothetical protein
VLIYYQHRIRFFFVFSSFLVTAPSKNGSADFVTVSSKEMACVGHNASKILKVFIFPRNISKTRHSKIISRINKSVNPPCVLVEQVHMRKLNKNFSNARFLWRKRKATCKVCIPLLLQGSWIMFRRRTLTHVRACRCTLMHVYATTNVDVR